MTDLKEKTLQLIRKLFAKAESARDIGSAAEAAAFAEKANNLLLQHKLDMTDLELIDEQDADPLGAEHDDARKWGGSSAKWSTQLVTTIAVTHFCRVVWDYTGRRGSTLTLVGRATDRQIAVYLIRTLHREAQRLAKQFRKANPYGDRTSFLHGFVTEVRRRLVERRQQVEVAGGQFALVRLTNADAAVQDKVRELFPHTFTTTARRQRFDGASYGAGKAAGASVGLGGIGTGSASAGTLASARRLLSS